ncbi:MAG TPA: GNAT family N-acetyltransferase, partial [Acidobacteriota bacterium]|nr:GNAT family N-acetyltransferase [Acidobacteriota bacterium]
MEKAKRRALFLPPLYQDSAEEGRLILRDGSTAVIRIPQKADQERVRDFFDRLSPESRYSRFFSVAGPDEHFLRDVCNSDFHNRLSLSVHRVVEETPRIIAVGSYFRVDDKTAEVAFAVEDVFQGKGIGAHLLERLALLAVRNGFMRFMATTQSSNEPMLELFCSSGFKVHEKREGGFVQVDFSVIPTKESFDRSEMLDRVVTAASLRPFFKPKSVAVVGASREPGSLGYQIVHNLVNTGFKGEVYPINPHADLIDNVRAYHEIGKVPVPVDLAIIVVPARYVLEVVEDCALHGVRAVVVITAGFAEVSPAGIDIQKKLVEIVRAHGMRLIGPNCMGLMNTDPDVRLNASFSFVYPPHGRIAVSSQSGAL